MYGKTLAVFGDSIMYGSGNGGTGVGEYLSRSFGWKLLKYCVGGARVGYQSGKSWLIAQIRQAIADKIQPDYIVFDGFTNDCNMGDGKTCDVAIGEISEELTDIFAITPDAAPFTRCFRSAVAAFKEYFPAAKILFVRPHKMGRRDGEAQKIYGDRAAEICAANGIAVADIYGESGLDTFSAEHRDLYTADTYGQGRGDCTHPNALGYEKFYMPIISEKLMP